MADLKYDINSTMLDVVLPAVAPVAQRVVSDWTTPPPLPEPTEAVFEADGRSCTDSAWFDKDVVREITHRADIDPTFALGGVEYTAGNQRRSFRPNGRGALLNRARLQSSRSVANVLICHLRPLRSQHLSTYARQADIHLLARTTIQARQVLRKRVLYQSYDGRVQQFGQT